MSREVQVNLICDGPRHQERTLAVHEYTVAIDHGKPRVFAVCETCQDIIGMLIRMMENGSDVSAGELTDIEKVDQNICPECDFQSASRQALGQHLKKMHDKGIKAYKT